MSTFSLSSAAFDDGDPIPEKYGYTENNVNPPLSIDGVPDEAESMALIMDDPDAREPAGKIWDHWVVWNIDPDTTEIPEDWSAGAVDEGENDYGESGYGGPNPPDREHTYYFKLYALDTKLDLPPSTNSSELENAMNPHIIDETELTGTYTP